MELWDIFFCEIWWVEANNTGVDHDCYYLVYCRRSSKLFHLTQIWNKGKYAMEWWNVTTIALKKIPLHTPTTLNTVSLIIQPKLFLTLLQKECILKNIVSENFFISWWLCQNSSDHSNQTQRVPINFTLFLRKFYQIKFFLSDDNFYFIDYISLFFILQIF